MFKRYCPLWVVGGDSRRSLKGRGRDCSTSFLRDSKIGNELAEAFWVGTLLGPETTHVVCGFSGSRSFSALLGPNRGSPGGMVFFGGGGRWVRGGGVCWLVFENCIVDASIFDRLWC
jgi:hypothetical protein